MRVWVLTSEYNLYDQQGEYFVKVFASKPTVEQLRKVIEADGVTNESDAYFERVHNGGGRDHYEHYWYNLNEVEAE